MAHVTQWHHWIKCWMYWPLWCKSCSRWAYQVYQTITNITVFTQNDTRVKQLSLPTQEKRIALVRTWPHSWIIYLLLIWLPSVGILKISTSMHMCVWRTSMVWLFIEIHMVKICTIIFSNHCPNSDTFIVWLIWHTHVMQNRHFWFVYLLKWQIVKILWSIWVLVMDTQIMLHDSTHEYYLL